MVVPNVGAGSYSKNDYYKKANFQWVPFTKTSGVSDVAQAASIVQQAYDKVKQDREEAQTISKREEALKRHLSSGNLSRESVRLAIR
ncbi:hypothetical protein VNO78_08683 [Psophocarpus tetragonolobus]|uniref:Uncharacterized protein n=1 Tax=Psophocarpus tetragonolobus TaxID=3891 RepID=A0AAN9T5R4_PSOTE